MILAVAFCGAIGCSTADAPPPKIGVIEDTLVAQPGFVAAIEPSGDTGFGRVVDTVIDTVVRADASDLPARGLLIPVAGVKWSELRDSFHDKRGTRTHNALDIMAPRGTPVMSVDAGTVLKLHNSVPGGLTVYAADPTRRFIYLYGHLDSYYSALREGERISRGDTIGYVGSTGNAAAAGPHLHFAMARNSDMSKWWQGTPVDSRPLMR